VIQTAEILKLRNVIKEGLRNLMPEIVPIDEGMNDLIELDWADDSQLQYLVDTNIFVLEFQMSFPSWLN
jgi:hypothetical protein